ncbi:MAG TPA: hypothetical protein VNL91_06650 [Thermoanaerobaculia bacterium]|nr:hypothetical protein [Thermoanaerobaculia bacterium]
MFIEWDHLEVRVDGERLNAFAQRFRVPPVERMELRFENGRLRVEGVVRKWIAVPFQVEITEIVARGTTLRFPLHAASAFGAIPVPRFLFGLFREQMPEEMIGFEEPATFVLSLDRFLPAFVKTEIRNIWIIDGGLAVILGRGGADLPLPGGNDERR